MFTGLWSLLSQHFAEPRWLLAALLALPLAWWSWRTLNIYSRAWRAWWISLRCLVLILLVAAMARFQNVRETDRQTVVFLIDRSQSVLSKLESLTAARPPGRPVPAASSVQDPLLNALRATAGQPRPGDHAAIVSFAGQPRIEQPPIPPAADGGPIRIPRLAEPREPEQTGIADALQLALALFPADSARRIVLLSDGNENAGQAMDQLGAIRAARASVDVVPLAYQRSDEVLVERVDLPSTGRAGETVRIHTLLRSTGQATGELHIRVFDDEQPRQAEGRIPPRPVRIGPGLTRIPRLDEPPIEIRLRSSGLTRVEVQFVAEQGDRLTQNNRAGAMVHVRGDARILLLTTDVQADQPLVDALTRQRVQVQTISVPATDRAISLALLNSFDAVLLSNVPATALPPELHVDLHTYVERLGGGLAMFGGDASFGAGGWRDTPVERILPVSLDIEGERQRLASALVLVIDRSGSMTARDPASNRSKQELANEAAVASARTLTRLDWLGVVAFDGAPDWVVALAPNTNLAGATQQILRIGGGGGTNIAAGLTAARSALKGLPAQTGVRHIILLTDGIDGSGQDLIQMARDLAADKIALTTIGVGDDVDAPLLEQMARATGQRCHIVRDTRLLPQILTRETRLVNRPYINELVFRPQMVRSSPLVDGFSDGAFPPLEGLVLTSRRRGELAATVQVPLVGTDLQAPILASWRYGKGRSLAFTSGWWNRWGPRWVAWEGFSKLWGQSARWLMREPGDTGIFELITSTSANAAHITVDAVDVDGRLLTAEQLELGGTLAGAGIEPVSLMFSATKPGRFEARTGLSRSGDYAVSIDYVIRRTGADGAVTRTAGQLQASVNVPYSPEFRDLQSNDALLARLADSTGGRVIPLANLPSADFFERSIASAYRVTPLWEVLLLAGLAVFLLDIAARRINFDLRRLFERLAGALAGLVGRRANVRAEAVGSLLEVRNRTRAERTAAADASASPPAPSTRSLVSEMLRSTPQATPASQDILPFDTDQPASPPQSAAESAERAEPADAASRLRAAKARARMKMDDRDPPAALPDGR